MACKSKVRKDYETTYRNNEIIGSMFILISENPKECDSNYFKLKKLVSISDTYSFIVVCDLLIIIQLNLLYN